MVSLCFHNVSCDVRNMTSAHGVAMWTETSAANLEPPMLTLLAALSAAASAAGLCPRVWDERQVGCEETSRAEEALRSLKDKVNDSDKAMRDEPREAAKNGRFCEDDRDIRKTLASFEKRLDENAKTQQDLLRQQFEDLPKQLHTQGKQSLDAVKGRSGDGRETIDGDPRRQRQAP